MQERDEKGAEKPQRPRYPDFEEPQPKKTNPLLLLGVAVALSVFVSMMWVNNAGFASGDDFNELKDSIDKSQSSITASINNIPNLVTTQVNTVLGNVNNQVNNVQNTVNSLKTQVSNQNSKIDNAVKGIASLNSKVDSLTKANTAQNTKITALEAKVKALEATDGSSSGSTVKSTIPNVTISAKVTEEGVLTSGNLTAGEIKLTLVNSGKRDIEDVVLYVYVYFDNCSYTTQKITSSSYGSWSIRERERDYVELKGRLSRLVEGESRRIYIGLTSKASRYYEGEVTYLDVSSSDVEVVDWNYE